MSTVLFMGGARDWYRDIILEQDELWISPIAIDTDRTRYRPQGEYDVAAWLERLEPPYNNPDLVVCDFGNPGTCWPVNLEKVKAKKVLMVADVHHGVGMLYRAVKLAVSEPWDMVFLTYTRQHAWWFKAAGANNVQWIPCFMISPYKMPPPTKRTRGVTFVGSHGMAHPYRMHVLRELDRRGIKVEVISTGMDREAAARIHNESLVSLNVSLNGDFNLRNFEIMAAGGCLMTDRLCEQSGQGELKPETGCARFVPDGVDRMVEQVQFLIDRPYNADRVARNGFDYFWSHHSPAHKIADFHAALAGKQTWTDREHAESNIDFWQRLAAYEQMQEAKRTMHLPQYLDDARDLL